LAGALEGIKVVELGHWLVGPYCANMLSDLGAEVTKIEPLTGDQVRKAGSKFKNGESYMFGAYNHGKKSISLNMKCSEGLRIAMELCADADIIVENYRPGTCDRLGVGYEQVKKVNPRIVYCSISAFGESNAYAHRPGMDPIIQGMGAVMSLTGEVGGDPLLVGVPIADITTAYMAFGAICAALYARERSGMGDHIHVSMIETMVFNLSTRFGQYLATGTSPIAMGNQHAEVVPYQAFRTKDGWLMAGAQSNEAWISFCNAIDRSDLTQNTEYATNSQRVLHRDQLSRELNSVFCTRSTEEWCTILSKKNILHGPIYDVKTLVESDLIRGQGLITTVKHEAFGDLPVVRTPLKFSRTSVRVQGPPPFLGEHTVEILQKLGYSEGVITRLIKEGIIRTSTPGDRRL